MNAQSDHYRIESDYARRIVATAKGTERTRLLREAYDEIKRITDAYAPGLSETGHVNILTPIIRKLAQPPASVLDVGCARGELLTALAAKGYSVLGIDLSSDYISIASRSLGSRVEVADFSQFETPERFDIIVADNVLEHIPADSAVDALRKMRGLLNPGGHVLILTPHRWTGPHDISCHFLPKGSIATGLHLKEYTFSETRRVLLEAGFGRVSGFWAYPGSFPRIHFTPSVLAAWKAIACEAAISALHLRRLVDWRVVALLFPMILVGHRGLLSHP